MIWAYGCDVGNLRCWGLTGSCDDEVTSSGEMIRLRQSLSAFKRHLTLTSLVPSSLPVSPSAPLYLRTLWRYTKCFIVIIPPPPVGEAGFSIELRCTYTSVCMCMCVCVTTLQRGDVIHAVQSLTFLTSELCPRNVTAIKRLAVFRDTDRNGE